MFELNKVRFACIKCLFIYGQIRANAFEMFNTLV